MNTGTVTASLVARRPTPVRVGVEVPSPVAVPPAALSPSCCAVTATHRPRLAASRRRCSVASSPRHCRGPPFVFRTRSSKSWRRPWDGGSAFLFGWRDEKELEPRPNTRRQRAGQPVVARQWWHHSMQLTCGHVRPGAALRCICAGRQGRSL